VTNDAITNPDNELPGPALAVRHPEVWGWAGSADRQSRGRVEVGAQTDPPRSVTRSATS
jgi:hypothetical protein